MKVVAISGWKGNGKDTAAAYLVSNGYTRSAFADVLKDMVADEYGVPRSHMDDPKFKEKAILHLPVSPKDDFALNIAKLLYKEFRTENGHPPMEYFIDPSGTFLGVLGRDVAQLYWTPRALCILKGSTNRSVDSSYWVNRTIDEIRKIHGSMNVFQENFVISDLRYRSEVEQLRQAFGKDLVTMRINRFESINSTDASENDLNNYKFDIVIDNVGTIEELYYHLDQLVLNV